MRTCVFFFCLLFVICLARRDANQKLKACCARQKTADKMCKKRFCDFEAIHQGNMLHYLNTCGPKNQTVQLMWDCASSRADHTECCKKNNVLPACLPYCAAQGTVPNEQVTHVFCMQNFNNIRECFRSHLEKRPNIFGDN
ncbi:DB domain-containing protein [Caenorhabditis elegans]|uniref:Domain of unknown function DB domain-containing protein n=1 Tax=Caenorhabditis elegans TaxID=6239 RepID=Q95QK4_CAEEL|nr:protein of unknown function DB domain-containing protein [Caenorhabditis elegans]CCD68199.1 Domain of unknown function DB domain-containing protein [Caenorhabditis elegans]|eukprot:NP_495327.1 Uncharacterized protein CELE_F18C5.9 [Caenorhabditis elegans]